MIFREGTISASQVELQLIQHEKENNYDLVISKVSGEAPFPTATQHHTQPLSLQHWVSTLPFGASRERTSSFERLL
jgi:hypothetical protein